MEAKKKYAPESDPSALLDKKQIKHVQGIIGSLLYYARAVDPTILVALNELSAQQATPTVNTRKKLNHLLDYVATFPHAILRFHVSDMVLHVDSDAAYLVMPKARSRITGHYYLSDHPFHIPVDGHPKPNAPILTECRTLRYVVASAAEAETGGIFHNARTAIPIRQTLTALNHPQPATPIKTDNSTAKAFVTKNLRQKKSKSWDMRFHWLRDRDAQKHFKIFWESGKTNWADYFTKHHSIKHHKVMRPKYIHMNNCVNYVKSEHTQKTSFSTRGCVDALGLKSLNHLVRTHMMSLDLF